MAKSIPWLAVVGLLASSSCIDTTPTAIQATPDDGEEGGALAFPDIIPLPVDPDGIAMGGGTAFFVGDFDGDEGIYRGDLRTGAMRLLRATDGRPTTGLKFDERSGYLFAARGESGWATVIATGDARRIRLGKAGLCFADGNLLVGHTLYVMQNVLGRMAVVRLSLADLTGTVDGYIEGPYPMTTMARHGMSLYAVTSEFQLLPAPRQAMRFGLVEDLDANGDR